MCHYCNLHVFLSEKFSSSQAMDVGNFLNHVNSCVVHVHVNYFFLYCYWFESGSASHNSYG